MALHQSLLLQFKRVTPSVVLTVKRADGTLTWMRLHPGLEVHDLAHYAVESVLGLEFAFYGLLARGYNIEDFEAPKEARHPELEPKNLRPEALQTEHLVNLLLTELQFGVPIDGFLLQFAVILEEKGLPPMARLTTETLDEIRDSLNKLCTCWRAIAPGETMELRLE